MGVIKFLVVSFIVCIFHNVRAEKVIVNTVQGEVSGKSFNSFMYVKKYYGFMGIPFAAPPVGELRFLPPIPHEPWDGVLEAHKEKPACAQYNYNIVRRQPFGIYGREDCLYLDVFTPNLPANTEEKYPVIVFIYNEQFRNSYNKSLHYGPDFFIEEGVILVTISHRLSVFGFLSLEEDTLPGNSGLKDIVLALQWVNDNIKFFGGDDSRITVMGSQGGAAAVDLLLHSPARKLFHAAILQSGTSWSSQYLQKNSKQRAYKLAEVLNLKPDNDKNLVKELNNVSVDELLMKEFDAIPVDYFSEEQKNLLAFGPTVETHDNSLISAYPENKEIDIDIPLMIGFNSREGLEGILQYMIEPRYLSFVENAFALNMPRRVNFRFDPEDDVYYEAVQEIKDFYFSGQVKISKPSEYITYTGDVLNMYAIDYTVRLYANVSTKPIYYYNFDYSSELNENKMSIVKEMTVKDGTWGAITGDELCYLFKCPKLTMEYRNFNLSNSEEINVHRKMTKMWTNFAKYGVPTTKNNELLDGIGWEPYSLRNKEYLKIDKKFEMKSNLNAGRFKFWDKFLDNWEKLAANGVIKGSMKEDRSEL